MTGASDTDLVAAIRRGELDAESALYERFSARVFYLALRQLRRREDAEDARAETFLRVLQALRAGTLREPRALPGFVLETTRNIVRERSRQQARTQAFEGEADDMASPPAMQADPIATRAIGDVLEELLPRERAFLRMHYFEERSKEEISEALGIKEERVRLVKSRALKRFRDRWQELQRSVIQTRKPEHSI